MELPIQNPTIQFALLIGLAFLGMVIFSRLHLPGLVGLLLIGMVIGPGGAGLLPLEPLVSMLGQVGLVYVMFIAGLEIDLGTVQAHRSGTVLYGILLFFASLVPTVFAGLILGYPLVTALLLGSAISSHTLLSYPVVKNLGLVGRTVVVKAVGGTLITDTLALALFAVIIQVARDGNHNRVGAIAALLPLLYLGLLALAGLLLVPRTSSRIFEAQSIPLAEKGLYALAIMLLIAIIAELIGTEQILGAFLAGLLLNREMSRRATLMEHVDFFGRMFFFPLFFIWTGMLLEIQVLLGDLRVWALAGLLTFLVVLGKTLATLAIGTWHGHAGMEWMLMIGLTIPQAAATLAISVTAYNLGLFTETIMDAMVITIFVTSTTGPILSGFAGRRISRVGA